jgi:Tol biopolymer transport system component
MKVLILILLISTWISAQEKNHDKECPFGQAQNLGPTVNGSLFDGGPTVSTDERTLIFATTRDLKTDQQDLYISKRERTKDPWGKADRIEIVNDPISSEFSPRLSYDGKTLYFGSNRDGGFGTGDLYVSTRESVEGPWGLPVNLGPVINTKLFEGFPTPSSDGNTLYFERSTSISSHDSDIWMSTRANSKAPWSAPKRLADTINSPRSDFSSSISADGLSLYFASERNDNIGIVDIWVSTRQSLSDQWSQPRNLGPNVNARDSMTLAPYITASGNSLYFMSSRSGGSAKPDCKFLNCFDLYVAERKCGSDSAQ